MGGRAGSAHSRSSAKAIVQFFLKNCTPALVPRVEREPEVSFARFQNPTHPLPYIYGRNIALCTLRVWG